jgi:hypothetical protein
MLPAGEHWIRLRVIPAPLLAERLEQISRVVVRQRL